MHCDLSCNSLNYRAAASSQRIAVPTSCDAAQEFGQYLQQLIRAIAMHGPVVHQDDLLGGR